MVVWSTFTASWVGNNYDKKKENISIPNRSWGSKKKYIYFINFAPLIFKTIYNVLYSGIFDILLHTNIFYKNDLVVSGISDILLHTYIYIL